MLHFSGKVKNSNTTSIESSKDEIKQIVGKRVRAGLWLGNFLQGRSKVMLVIMKQDRYGLDYKVGGKERKKQMKKIREKRMASLKDAIVEGKPMVFPYYMRPFT